jgi:catechol 2,3-dioxygenase
LRALVRASGRGAVDRHACGRRPIGTCIFHVATLRDAEAFYHSALGFDQVVWSYPGALFLFRGRLSPPRRANTWAAGAPSPLLTMPRLLEWELRLPRLGDVASAAANAARAGNEIHEAATTASLPIRRESPFD